MQLRPRRHCDELPRRVECQGNNRIFESEHVGAHVAGDVPDAYLVAEAARGDDVGVGGVVFDRPGGAGVASEGGKGWKWVVGEGEN